VSISFAETYITSVSAEAWSACRMRGQELPVWA